MWRTILEGDQCKMQEEQCVEVPDAALTMWRGPELMELVDQEEMKTMETQWTAHHEEFVNKIVDRQCMEIMWVMVAGGLVTPLTYGCTNTELVEQVAHAIYVQDKEEVEKLWQKNTKESASLFQALKSRVESQHV